MDIKQLVEERGKTHGNAEASFTAIRLMEQTLNSLAPAHGANMFQHCRYMILSKLARSMHTPRERDHWLDIQGFAELALQQIGRNEAKSAVVPVPTSERPGLPFKTELYPPDLFAGFPTSAKPTSGPVPPFDPSPAKSVPPGTWVGFLTAEQATEARKTYAYICGPYSHKDPKVEAARLYIYTELASYLMRRGVPTMSPVTYGSVFLTHGFKGDFDSWKNLNAGLIRGASFLIEVLLPGFEQSEGVRAERQLWDAYKDNNNKLRLDSDFLRMVNLSTFVNTNIQFLQNYAY